MKASYTIWPGNESDTRSHQPSRQ